jgi:3-methyl-2-oxobutanoate hydroxymethyltransferase
MSFKKIIFKNKPIVCLTSYNKFFANIADEFCDLILVGDSMGTAYYGDKTTRQVSMGNIIRHAKSVRKGIKKAILVVDMPFKSYGTKAIAKKNALKIIKETKCDAVKLEGGMEISKIVEYLVKNKINVMGHIGLLPQKVRSNKGYKIKGKTFSENKKILKDLKTLQDAGVFSIVLEAVKYSTAQQVVKISNIPIIGIGASNNCHGQILVLEDMLGLFDKVPKFVKKYLNLKKQIRIAIKKYAMDVKKRKFPSKKNIYY